MWTSCAMQELTIVIALLLTTLLPPASGKASVCSWSNEGCSSDGDCCSKSCYRAFDGVNARCRPSTIGERCIFEYHCGQDLDCGRNLNCCAPYWKICNKDSDCCDPQHVCRPADGFYYKRCLYASAQVSFLSGHVVILVALTFVSLNLLGFLKTFSL